MRLKMQKNFFVWGDELLQLLYSSTLWVAASTRTCSSWCYHATVHVNVIAKYSAWSDRDIHLRRSMSFKSMSTWTELPTMHHILLLLSIDCCSTSRTRSRGPRQKSRDFPRDDAHRSQKKMKSKLHYLQWSKYSLLVPYSSKAKSTNNTTITSFLIY